MTTVRPLFSLGPPPQISYTSVRSMAVNPGGSCLAAAGYNAVSLLSACGAGGPLTADQGRVHIKAREDLLAFNIEADAV
jgi:uncharacterized protein (DUF2345 family)